MLSGDNRISWTSQAEVIADPPEKAMGAAQEVWLPRGGLRHRCRPTALERHREFAACRPFPLA